MGRMSARLQEALEAVGATLKRAKKHRVYALPNGRTFVVGNTPSDKRADRNAISDLKAVAGVAFDEPRRKAPAEIRAERRNRPGRAGERPWPVGSSPLASALRDSGIVEQQLRDEIAQLKRGIAELTAAVDELAATVREKDERIADMERMAAVRFTRWLQSRWK